MITQENIPYTADEIKSMVKTIEELRKKYNDALERAKYALTTDMDNSGHWAVNYIFPELKESEDERARKDLITFLDDVWHLGKNANFDKWGKADCSNWLAWLEKQGKNAQPDIPEDGQILNSLTDMDKRVFLDRPVTLRAAIAWLEKQGWLEKCEQSQFEPNPAWSEEDEEMFKSIIATCELAEQDRDSSPARHLLEMQTNWLKSIKDRVQPQREWGEEDEEMLTWLCRIIHTQRLDRAITLKEESELGEWIDKWLNHNPHTKQSEQPTDKIKTKFKAGDYIVPDYITPLEIWRVINIDEDGYYNVQSITNPEDDEIYRVPAFALEKDYYNLDNLKKKN